MVDKKWLMKIGVLSVAVIGLALVMVFLPKRITTRQKAFFGNVNIKLNPASASKAVNQEFDVNINIEAAGNKASGIDLYLNFDQSKLQIVSFTPNTSAFPTDLTNNDPGYLGATTGVARLMAVNITKNLPTGNFTAGTMKIKGKTASSTPVTLTINKTTSKVAGENPNYDPNNPDVGLAIGQTANGSYTFTGAVADGAALANTIPGQMVKGQSYSFTITATNNGTNSWTEANKYRLGWAYGEQVDECNCSPFTPACDCAWKVASVWKCDGTTKTGNCDKREKLGASETIASGQSKVWTISVKAPATAGNYPLKFRMLKEFSPYFGDTIDKTVQVTTTVVPTNTPVPTIPPANCPNPDVPTLKSPADGASVPFQAGETNVITEVNPIAINLACGSVTPEYSFSAVFDRSDGILVGPWVKDYSTDRTYTHGPFNYTGTVTWKAKARYKVNGVYKESAWSSPQWTYIVGEGLVSCQPVNKVIEVTPIGGAGTCHDIQKAVNAVNGEGYTIMVEAGNYNLTTTKYNLYQEVNTGLLIKDKTNLTISGAHSGAGAKIILGTIGMINGRFGVVWYNSTGTLTNIGISGNNQYYDAAIFSYNSEVEIISNDIRNVLSGNAIEATGSKGKIVSNVLSDVYRALYLIDNTDAFLIENNSMQSGSNQAGGSAEAIYLGKTPATIRQNLIRGYLSGISTDNFSKPLVIEHNTIIENGIESSSSGGGIVQLPENNATIKNNLIIKNYKYGIVAPNSAIISYNDVWSNGQNYYSSDKTGTNGNISADPLLDSNYCLKAGSPAIYGDVSKQEYMGHVGPCSPAQDGVIKVNFKVKYQDVDFKAVDQKVLVKVKQGSYERTFTDINTVADDDGVYSGQVTLTDVAPGSSYAIFIKGPKHLAKKFCVNQPTKRCLSGDGKIVLTTGVNTFDFSTLVLEAGDVPDPNNNNKQDGVANSADWSLVKSLLAKTDRASLDIADLDLDGKIGSNDFEMVKSTIETRYEDEE